MKFKKALAVILATTMISSLVGCGSTTTTTETETSGESGGKKVLSVTTWDNETSPQFQATIDAYMEANPDVEIKIIDTSADEYNNSLGISLSSAQPDPDIIFVKDMGSMLSMADKNQIMPIDELIARDSVDTSVYNGAAEQLKYNDVSYGLPYRSDWYVLYYNKNLFDAARIEYPSNDMTWEEYYALAEKMTSGEGSSKVYGTHNHTWHGLVANWAIQDGKNTVVEKDYSFLKPYYEKTLELQEKGFIQDYSTLKTANIHYSSVFKNEQIAMMPMGTWFISAMMQAQEAGETNFDWGIAKIPHPADTEAGYTVGALTPVVISAYTDQQELAWDFMKFATSADAANILAGTGTLTGIQTEEAINIIASAEFFPKGDSNKEALTYTNYVFDRTLDPKISEIKTVFDEVHELIMIKQISIDDGIKQLQERVAKIKGW